MDDQTQYQKALAVAIADYRQAKADVLEAIRTGKTRGDEWTVKKIRLSSACEKWGKVPRRFCGST